MFFKAHNPKVAGLSPAPATQRKLHRNMRLFLFNLFYLSFLNINCYNHLMKLSENRIIGGVCGGISERFQINSALVRVVFLVLSIIFLFPFLIYAFLWLILPTTGNKKGKNSGVLIGIFLGCIGAFLGFFVGRFVGQGLGYTGGESIISIMIAIIGIPIGAIGGFFLGLIIGRMIAKRK